MRITLLILLTACFNACLLAAAPPATQAAPTPIPIRHANVSRAYILHLPRDLDPSRPAPVVMMLHGAGGSALGSATRNGWREKADREGFIAVFPEATRFDMSRPENFLNNPRLWNDGSGRGFAARRNVDDIGYLRAVLDDVAKRANIDANRIYCTGFSNGASMTFRAGVELSDRLAAIAPISGHFWIKDPKPPRKLPMFFLTGNQDPLNPLAGGEVDTPWGSDRKPPILDSVTAWVKMLGIAPPPKTLRDDDGVKALRYGDDSLETIVYTIEGLGHEWPGQMRALPEKITGPTTSKVDATTLVWEFFSKHPRK